MFQNTSKWDQEAAAEVVGIIDDGTRSLRKLLAFIGSEDTTAGIEQATDLLATIRSAALSELGGIVYASRKGTKLPAAKPTKKMQRKR